MAKKQIPQKMDVIPEGIPAPYGIRKTFNHVIPRKKKRVNSIVKMKPLKDRDNIYELPEFCPNGYTRLEFDLYREEFERIKELTKEDLKQILKLNKQDNSAQMRSELLNRCADGYALGKIKTCPHCFGNIPVFDKHKGTYYCSGYREGQQFVKCDSTFSREQLPRVKPWDNNFQLRESKRLQRTERKLKNQRQYQTLYKKNKKERLKKQAESIVTQKKVSRDSDDEDYQNEEQKQPVFNTSQKTEDAPKTKTEADKPQESKDQAQESSNQPQEPNDQPQEPSDQPQEPDLKSKDKPQQQSNNIKVQN